MRYKLVWQTHQHQYAGAFAKDVNQDQLAVEVALIGALPGLLYLYVTVHRT